MAKEAISDFIPVSVSTLRQSEQAGIDLFQSDESGSDFVLYCAGDHPLDQLDLDRLKGRGVHRLFIKSDSRESFQVHLRSLVNGQDSGTASIAARAGALNDVVRDVLETQFNGGDTDGTVKELQQLGAVTADIVCHDEFAASDLFRVLHHDYATFTHSANVAFYVGMLASEFGYPKSDVELITTAGLLHDLGKLGIEERILCKPGKLSDEEFDVIRAHPTIGFEQLCQRKDLTEGQLMVVYQHHERLDGKGYPVGAVESEIHDWAKLCAVVDVFEALTSFRPYRSPMSRTKAIEILDRDSGKAFDPEALTCWKKITNAVWGA